MEAPHCSRPRPSSSIAYAAAESLYPLSPPKAVPPGRGARRTYAIAVAHVAALAAFVVLRRHQLSLPDPHHNPWTGRSTACYVAALGLWAAGVVWALRRRARDGGTPTAFRVWLALAILLVLVDLWSLLSFLVP